MKDDNVLKLIGCRASSYCSRILCLLAGVLASTASGEDGYRLWMRYEKMDSVYLSQYSRQAAEIVVQGQSDTFSVIEKELQRGLSGLLGVSVPSAASISQDGAIVVGTHKTSPVIQELFSKSQIDSLGPEGYIIGSGFWQKHPVTAVAAKEPIGALYGTFHLLRLMQTQQSLSNLCIRQKPQIQYRLLNHWDNLNGSVERGYAGRSLWQWEQLPEQVDARYTDYARANASIGINGTVLNNVNAQAAVLTSQYLRKAAVLAEVFRPYGIRVYLSVKFTAPIEIGGLDTADPAQPQVRQWWQQKADEIYRLIPDFGGFLVKAFSEGQPGPQAYGRTHADGANMLAEVLRPYGGILMWRSFVYDASIDSDRAKCAYKEFVPLDGQFGPNVFIQTKNGPIDFQPREPFNPLFGAMPKTPLMMELQITQEYTGQAKHLVYLAPQWKEVLLSDTFAGGPNTPVMNIVDGSAEGHSLSGIAGVSGIGTDRSWTGHHFSQANWYAFGRLAWDMSLSSEQIAQEWIRMTWTNDPQAVSSIQCMMEGSWQACVDYMTPLGLHHLMAEGHHYGPDPGFVHSGRADWSSTYYHRADLEGLGFDRTEKGSNAVSQYHPPLRDWWNRPETCPEKYLLWFHHIPWNQRLSSGQTLWQELQAHYQNGTEYVKWMQQLWESLEGKIDSQRYKDVQQRLILQYENAAQWRDVCLAYFGRFVRGDSDKLGNEVK